MPFYINHFPIVWVFKFQIVHYFKQSFVEILSLIVQSLKLEFWVQGD